MQVVREDLTGRAFALHLAAFLEPFSLPKALSCWTLPLFGKTSLVGKKFRLVSHPLRKGVVAFLFVAHYPCFPLAPQARQGDTFEVLTGGELEFTGLGRQHQAQHPNFSACEEYSSKAGTEESRLHFTGSQSAWDEFVI